MSSPTCCDPHRNGRPAKPDGQPPNAVQRSHPIHQQAYRHLQRHSDRHGRTLPQCLHHARPVPRPKPRHLTISCHGQRKFGANHTALNHAIQVGFATKTQLSHKPQSIQLLVAPNQLRSSRTAQAVAASPSRRGSRSSSTSRVGP